MNPRKLNRADLVEMAKNAANRLSNGDITSMPQNIADDFAAALTDASNRLKAKNKEVVERQAALGASVAEAQETRLEVVDVFASLKAAMRGANANGDEYELIMLDPPARRTPIKPNAPTGLAAWGESNRINLLKWNGNNVPGSVNYHIEAITDGKWQLVGTTTRQKFKHEDVTPGQPIMYRVYAKSARLGNSGHSNEAAVYKA